MKYADVAIPLGHAWSSPFAKWQGTLAEVPSLDLAVAARLGATGLSGPMVSQAGATSVAALHAAAEAVAAGAGAQLVVTD